jgi:hypothetical protein
MLNLEIDGFKYAKFMDIPISIIIGIRSNEFGNLYNFEM